MSKNNRLLIVFLIVLTALFFIIRHVRDPRERRMRFFDVNLADITSIEFKTATDTLIIVNDGFDWYIEHPFTFDIDRTRLDNFINQVLPVETSSIPVSVSEDSFTNYQVTEGRGTTLSFYGLNDRLLDTAIIGRSGRFAYARRPDEQNVYQLSENISFTVNPGINMWRSNNIVSIPRGFIEDLEVTYKLNQYNITATDSLWLFTDSEHSFSIPENNNALRRVLTTLERMTSQGFKDFQYEKYQDILQEPQLVLNISLMDGSETTLIFAIEEETNFIVQKNEQIDHLYMIDADTVDLFTRAPQHFQ